MTTYTISTYVGGKQGYVVVAEYDATSRIDALHAYHNDHHAGQPCRTGDTTRWMKIDGTTYICDPKKP